MQNTTTETDTSRFVRIKSGDLDLQPHYNDTGTGSDVVILLHRS